MLVQSRAHGVRGAKVGAQQRTRGQGEGRDQGYQGPLGLVTTIFIVISAKTGLHFTKDIVNVIFKTHIFLVEVMHSQHPFCKTCFNHHNTETVLLSLFYRQGEVFSWGSIFQIVFHGMVMVVLRHKGQTIEKHFLSQICLRNTAADDLVHDRQESENWV